MNKTIKLIGAIALAAIVAFSIAACGNGSTGPGTKTLSSTNYSWTDSASNIYDLIITEDSSGRAVTNGSYTLIITLKSGGATITSSGKASGSVTSITLTPNSGSAITIEISGETLTITPNTKIGEHTLSGGEVEVKTKNIAMTQAEADLQGIWKCSDKDYLFILTFAGNIYTQYEDYTEDKVRYQETKTALFTASDNIITLTDFNGNPVAYLKFSISGNRLTTKNIKLNTDDLVLTKQK